MPKDLATFIQRSGRTGRTHLGYAVSFYHEHWDKPLAQSIADVMYEAGQEPPRFLYDNCTPDDFAWISNRGGFENQNIPVNNVVSQRNEGPDRTYEANSYDRDNRAMYGRQSIGNNMRNSEFNENRSANYRYQHETGNMAPYDTQYERNGMSANGNRNNMTSHGSPYNNHSQNYHQQPVRNDVSAYSAQSNIISRHNPQLTENNSQSYDTQPRDNGIQNYNSQPAPADEPSQSCIINGERISKVSISEAVEVIEDVTVDEDWE